MILFRNTYKSAYKDIEADSELLSTILVKGLEKKKVIHKKWVYSFGTVAASFALVVCSVVGYMNYTPVDQIPLVVNNSDIEQVSEPNINETLVENKEKNVVKDKVESKDILPEKTEKADSGHIVSEPDNVLPSASQGDATQPKAADVPSVASVEPLPLSEPLGEAAYSEQEPSVGREVSHIEEMPLSDYYQYIGFNVLEKIIVPSDFVYSGEETVPYDKVSDVAMFNFFGDGSRFANISFAKKVENAENTSVENYEENNGIYNVKGVADTFSFEILTNITEEEVKELAESIVK